jgi:hypothetical protein
MSKVSHFFINATGLWTGITLADQPNYCSATPKDIYISQKDVIILRELAKELLALSYLEIQSTKRKLWFEHNSLRSTQPVIFVDPENGWNEIITGESIKCEGKLARRWEYVLRKELFWGKFIKDDKPVEPYFYVGYTWSESDWGLSGEFHGGLNGGSYTWDISIKDLNDYEKLKFKRIRIDYKSTLMTLELANCVFDGILETKLRSFWQWSYGLTWDLIRLIGEKNIYLYLIDKPKLIHKLMSFIKEGTLAKLDFLEKNNLLNLNNRDFYVGTGALGYTDELPKNSDGCSSIKAKDLWGNFESQETTGVSPEMFREFIYQYQLPLMQRFGLICYGCCEPLDTRWEIIKDIPNLRRISVSAWANWEKMSEYLGKKYIYSFKPSPSDLAVPVIDENSIRKKISNILNITKNNILEIVMKDNHTICRNPDNIINWVKIAREEVSKTY